MQYLIQNSTIRSINISDNLTQMELRFSTHIFCPRDIEFPMTLNPEIPEICQVRFMSRGGEEGYFEFYKMSDLTKMPHNEKCQLTQALTKQGLAITDEKHTIEIVLNRIRQLKSISDEIYEKIRKDVRNKIENIEKAKKEGIFPSKAITYQLDGQKNKNPSGKKESTERNNKYRRTSNKGPKGISAQ